MSRAGVLRAGSAALLLVACHARAADTENPRDLTRLSLAELANVERR